MKRRGRGDQEAKPAEPAEAGEGWIAPEPVAEALSLAEERRELEERLARLASEFQNSRRRLEREAASRAERTVEEALTRLLGILDHVDLALASAGDGGAAFVQGVALIRAEIAELLGREGVREVAARGARFDPKFHEAVAVEERTDVPPDTVLEEYRKGYARGERVLRAAQVRVARAPEAGAVPAARADSGSAADKPKSEKPSG